MTRYSARAYTHTASLYDTDVHRWTAEQALAVRDGRAGDIDWDNVAEEIESLGRNDRRALDSRMEVLIAHLLKYMIQPERRTRSWDVTIAAQRTAIARLSGRSPSLRAALPEQFEEVYAGGRRQAMRDTGLADSHWPTNCPFTLEQVLDPDFLPR